MTLSQHTSRRCTFFPTQNRLHSKQYVIEWQLTDVALLMLLSVLAAYVLYAEKKNYSSITT